MRSNLVKKPLSRTALKDELTRWLEPTDNYVPPLTEALRLGAFLAGGAFKDVLRSQAPKDLDLFSPNQLVFDAVVKAFRDRDLDELYENDNCVAFRCEDTSKVIEVVRARFGSPEEIINGFDLNLTQCAVYEQEGKYFVLRTRAFIEGMKHKTVRFVGVNQSERSMERLQRYHAYSFTVPDVELQRAVGVACSRRGCQSPVEHVLVSKDFFREASAMAQYGGVIMDGWQASFSRPLAFMDDVLHDIAHALLPNGTARTFMEEREERVKNVLCWPGEEAGLKPRFAPVPPVVRLMDLVQALNLPSETLKDVLVLLETTTVTPDYASWPAATVLSELLALAQARNEVEQLTPFLRDLVKSGEQPLTLTEWRSYMADPMFSFELPSAFYTPLFRTTQDNNHDVRSVRQSCRDRNDGKPDTVLTFW